MTLEDIKDKKKLTKLLKETIERNKYLEECVKDTAAVLEKHSFKYDGNPSTLKLQAMDEVNNHQQLKDFVANAQKSSITLESFLLGECYERELERYVTALEDIKEVIVSVLSCLEGEPAAYEYILRLVKEALNDEDNGD